MDADLRKRRRYMSQREQRWSMNSQRLEEIVAELMKPISDVRRSFDTDLSALLEEYLTEAGLHALAAAERSPSSQSSTTHSPTPNFAELALLLQQSASIYGRKVDCLYAHVLCVSDALHDNTQESSGAPDEPLTPSAGRRKRKASVSGDFAAITLEPCAGARREVLVPRPPPTLPRMYVELEPRVVMPGDVPLTDYTGEPIGLLGDFLVSRRLEGGLLVDELACGGEAPASRLRVAPLLELQAAITAASSPSPASLPSPTSRLETPPVTPAPLSPLSTPPAPTCLSVPSSERKERKRRSAVSSGDAVDGRVKLIIGKELRGKLRRVEEFSLPPRWVSRVVSSRAAALRAARRQHTDHTREEQDFRGFDISDSIDVGGFLGWSGSEAAAAVSLSVSLRGAGGEAGPAGGEARRADDSDDDGFFEQSSLGDSDTSRVDDTNATALSSLPGSGCEWWGWREAVMSRSAAAAARGADVSAGARAVLTAAGALPPPAACDALFAATAQHEHDISKLFLSALFLANSGNIEIVQGPALSVNSFSVRVLSTDERLYRAAAEDLPAVQTYQ